MKTIWKYPLELSNEQVIDMPEAAQILTIERQGIDGVTVDMKTDIVMWALVNTEAPIEKVLVEMFETGEELPSGKRTYISTLQANDGAYIIHTFKRENYGL